LKITQKGFRFGIIFQARKITWKHCHTNFALLDAQIHFQWTNVLQREMRVAIAALLFTARSEAIDPRLLKVEFIHSSMALQTFVGPWLLLQFHNFFFTQSVGLLGREISRRKVAAYTQKYSNPRSQRSSERRQFMPYTALPL
jgi:hypothetical protein